MKATAAMNTFGLFPGGIRALAAVASVLTVLACGEAGGQTAATKSPYVIGSANDFSGPFASIGRPFTAGMQTYAQWKNAQGGINGHPLKVVVLDDGGAPDKATSNAKAMLDQRPVMILGHVASQAAIPQQKVWDDAGIATTAYVPTIQLLTSPYFYAVGMSAPDSYKIQAAWIREQASKSGNSTPKVVFFTIDSPTQTVARKDSRALMESWGFKVLDEFVYAPASTDVTPQVLKIRELNPDYVVGGVTDALLPTVVQTLNRNGVTVPFINFVAGNAETSFKAINAQNFYAIREMEYPATPAVNADVKMMVDAAAKYRTTQDMNNIAFTKGWVSGMLLTEALSKCGDNCTAADVKKSWDNLKNFSIGGLGPPISFTASDHAGAKSGLVFKWDSSKGAAVAVSKPIQLPSP